MTARHPLQDIKSFPSLVKYLRDKLDWPIDTESFDDLTFDFAPEELGLKGQEAAKVRDIKQLRPLTTNQPWGIFFVSFEPKRLPVVALRKILGSLVIRKRASANRSERAAWQLHDLLFVSAFGEGADRQITLAHFSEGGAGHDIPTLKVLGWDELDTRLNLRHVGRQLDHCLRWPDDPADLGAWREQWSAAFVLRHKHVIRTAEELAVQLAALAQRIRRKANQVLAIESERGPLRKLFAAFREALIHDLNEDAFADMYAQTITYGLFSAAVSRTTADVDTSAEAKAMVVADNLTDMVPITNPFLREMLSTFLTVGGRRGKLDFDELGIQEVVEVLNSDETHLQAVVRSFGDRRKGEDPVIHFYEDFLKQYDKKLKVQRGVFYTPQPVVSYIVRSVHELLQTEFGLEDGLASTITWGEMARRVSCGAGFEPAVAPSQAAKMPAPQELVERSDPPLTAGSCVLRQPAAAQIVQDALLHFEGQRYHLCAWCVMPNHVHVVVQPMAEQTVDKILHSWKSFTANAINHQLGRQGPLWERESFNHLIRTAEHLEQFVAYTENNPVAAGMATAPADWPFSSAGYKSGPGAAGFESAPATPEAGKMPAPQGFPPAPLDFVDPRSTPFVEPRSRGELPHLYKEGGTYFITWRLLDAVELRRASQPLASQLATLPEAGKMPAPQFRIPEGTSPKDPFVVILDPATGTATFLVEVIDVIYRTMTEKWRRQGLDKARIATAWNEYVPQHLLPRLYGYELMMAPYAIAHMKIGLKLGETGYRFQSAERARIYLTNALDPPALEIQQRKIAELSEALPTKPRP